MRGRAGDRVNHGRLGPKGLFGWQASGSSDRLTRPLVREGGGWSRPTGTRRWAGSWSARQRCSTRTGRLAASASTPAGQLFLEEYYTLARHRQGGHRHPAHGRQHPAVHRDRGGGAEGVVRRRRPARLLHRHRPLRRDLSLRPQHGRDPDGAVDADAGPPRGPATRRGWCASTRGATPVAARGRRAPRAAPRHQPGADERPAPRADRRTAGSTTRYVAAHTLGFEELAARSSSRTRRSGSRRSAACRRATSRAAARDLRHVPSGSLSTVLQGFYQSHQATAAACQVNNLHLLRGMIGRPGRRRLQMNGQPTAQNTRECGADGDLPGLPQLGQPRPRRRSWPSSGTSTRSTIPHWAPPTHAMQIFRYAEQGSIELLWIIGDQPGRLDARARAGSASILAKPRAVRRRPGPLPDRDGRARRRRAAGRGLGREDRHVHQRRPHRAPLRARRSTRPARPAPTSTSSSTTPRRMGFRDRDGGPLIEWTRRRGGVRGLEGVLAAGGRATTRGLTYDRLPRRSGIQWPCTDERPDGTERLYTDGVFPTDPDYCETYGHDLVTGAPRTRGGVPGQASPRGRAFLKAPTTSPPPEEPDDELPAAADHRAHRLPLPHPHQDRPRARSSTRPRPTRGWRSAPADAAALGVARGRPRAGRVAARARSRRRRASAASAQGDGVRAVPLRLLGPPAERGPTPSRAPPTS